jgi:transposase
VALRHGVNANLLFNWRRRYGEVSPTVSESAAGPGFALIDLAPQSPEPAPCGIIEIELGGGERVRVGYDVDQPAVGRVLCALKAAR